jgi:hypothetical protein
MDIPEKINNINIEFDNIFHLLNNSSKKINDIKDTLTILYNEAKEIKDEKYYQISYNDDINFQLNTYCNSYLYQKNFFCIRKDKLFNDLIIFNDLLKYLIRYIEKNYKSKLVEYHQVKELKINNKNKKFKLSEIREVFNIIQENMDVLSKNIIIMDELCSNLKKKKIYIENIYNTFLNGINTIKTMYYSSITRFINTFKLHKKQLILFINNIELEYNSIKNGYNFNIDNDFVINIDHNKNNDELYKVGDTINIKVSSNRVININDNLLIQLKGNRINELLPLIRDNNIMEYHLDYLINNGGEKININLIGIQDVFGNYKFKKKGKTYFMVEETEEDYGMTVEYENNQNKYGSNKDVKILVNFLKDIDSKPILNFLETENKMNEINKKQFEYIIRTPDNKPRELKEYQIRIKMNDIIKSKILYVDNELPCVINLDYEPKKDNYQINDIIMFTFNFNKKILELPTIIINGYDKTIVNKLIKIDNYKFKYEHNILGANTLCDVTIKNIIDEFENENIEKYDSLFKVTNYPKIKLEISNGKKSIIYDNDIKNNITTGANITFKVNFDKKIIKEPSIILYQKKHKEIQLEKIDDNNYKFIYNTISFDKLEFDIFAEDSDNLKTKIIKDKPGFIIHFI